MSTSSRRDLIRSRGRTPSTERAVSPWSDALGRAGSRCAQVLLIAAVVAGLVWLLQQVSLVVIALLVALILASAVHPLVGWLVRKGWSRLLATVAAFLSTLLVLGGLVTGIVFAVRSEWDDLVSSATGGWDELQEFARNGPLHIDTDSVNSALEQATAFVTSGTFVGGALDEIGAAAEFVTGTVLMVITLFFFLKDGPRIWSFTLRWFHGETRAKLAESGDRSISVLGGYVRGTAIIAAVDAILIGIALAILGVPLALPLAVIVFLGGFVPIIGATVAGALAVLVALVTQGPLIAVVALAAVLVVNQLESHLLQPIVMGRTLSLHALVILLALAAGSLVSGVAGAVLAVPLSAMGWSVIQVWTDRYQAGDDPVLGQDPLSPKNSASAKASDTQRENYQRMREEGRGLSGP